MDILSDMLAYGVVPFFCVVMLAAEILLFFTPRYPILSSKDFHKFVQRTKRPAKRRRKRKAGCRTKRMPHH